MIDLSFGVVFVMKAVTWIYLRPVFIGQSSQMKCGPNYILSDAQQQVLPSEKLISECPLRPVSITGFPKASAAVCGQSGESVNAALK